MLHQAMDKEAGINIFGHLEKESADKVKDLEIPVRLCWNFFPSFM